MRDGKPVNSWDISQRDKAPYISALRGNWAAYRSGVHCNWEVNARPEETFPVDPDEKLAWGMREGRVRVWPTFPEAAAWAREHYGITGWARDKWGAYHPSETEHDEPCEVHVYSRERATAGGPCDRKRKPGEEMCGLHLAAGRRAEAKVRERRERNEASDAAQRIAKDAVTALAAHGVTAGTDYGGWGHGYTGRVTIHAEDVLAMLRELDELRELRDL